MCSVLYTIPTLGKVGQIMIGELINSNELNKNGAEACKV